MRSLQAAPYQQATTSSSKQQLGSQEKQYSMLQKDFELQEDSPSMVLSRIRSLKSFKKSAEGRSGSSKALEASKVAEQLQDSPHIQTPSVIPSSEAEERIRHSREASTSGR